MRHYRVQSPHVMYKSLKNNDSLLFNSRHFGQLVAACIPISNSHIGASEIQLVLAFIHQIGKTSKFKRISFRRLVWSNLENKPSMDGCSTVVLFISGRKDWRIWISVGGISGIWISLGGIFYFLCRWHTSVPGKLPVLNVSSFRGTNLIPSGF